MKRHEWRSLLWASDFEQKEQARDHTEKPEITGVSNSTAVLVGMYIESRHGDDINPCFPSLTTISRDTHLSRSTVCKYLDLLETHGLIRRDRGSTGRSTRYHLTDPTSPLSGLGSTPDGLAVVRSADPNIPVEDTREDTPYISPAKRQQAEVHKTAVEVIDWLNIKTGKKFQAVNGTLRPVVARLRELTGPDYRFDLDAAKTICMTVVADQTEKWIGDEKMRDYLTTKTLFRDSNFPVYAADIIDHNIRLRDEQCTNAPSATHRSTPTSPTFAPTEDAPGNDRSESQTESLPLHEIFSRRSSQKNAQH